MKSWFNHNTKFNKVFFVITVLMLALFGCSKSKKCKGDDTNSGIIISSIQIDCEPETDKKEFIITHDSVYKRVFPSNCNLPVINFSDYSLLGKYAEGDCTTKFERKVESLENDKIYQYNITVNDCGLCKKLDYSYNWVLVPKLQFNWNVKFKVIKK